MDVSVLFTESICLLLYIELMSVVCSQIKAIKLKEAKLKGAEETTELDDCFPADTFQPLLQ